LLSSVYRIWQPDEMIEIVWLVTTHKSYSS